MLGCPKQVATIAGNLRLGLGLLSSAFGLSIAPAIAQEVPTAATTAAIQMVRQGREQYVAGNLQGAEANLRAAAERFAAQAAWQPLAATLTNLGRVEYATGRFDPAIATWEQAATLYRHQLANPAAAGDLKVLQAEALRELGLYPRACQVLTQALTIDAAYCTTRPVDAAALAALPAPNSETRPLQISGWRDLGKLLRVLGRLEESLILLETQTSRLPPSIAREASEVSLGLTLQEFADRKRDRQAPIQFDYLPWHCETPGELAVDPYRQAAVEKLSAAARSSDPLVRTQARLNLLTLIARRDISAGAAEALTSSINFEALPPGHPRLYARLQVAKSRACLQQLARQEVAWDALTQELESVIRDARQIGDRRAESAAWGHLGELYELRAQLAATPEPWQEKGQTAVEQAILLAQATGAADLAYQWEWQLGRLLRARGQEREAIVAYGAAVESLEKVRSDLLAVDADVQFSFRDNVEPLYRELVALLIPNEAEVASLPQAELQDILARSLYYVESLQLAELENFLQCSLLGQDTQGLVAGVRTRNLQDLAETILQADPNAALVYPILLQDGLAVIYKLPGQPLGYHRTILNPETQNIESVLDRLQRSFLDPSRAGRTKELAGQLYDWIILPIEAELEALKPRGQSQIKTLAFVLDGALRNIPMSVLYNSRRQAYLLERYAIATASSLQLLEAQRPTTPKKALIAGVSEGRDVEGRRFTPLPNVTTEVATISAALPSDVLQDRELIRTRLAARIATTPYDIVHIATHGEFSSDPNETFLLLSDGLLKAREFGLLLQNHPEDAIELLVLSACETAQGDRRAALGLAGIALRAGTLSTLATLWQVDDEATAELMGRFYQQVAEEPSLSKAEALRRAQLQLWESGDRDWRSPFYWAPYTLLGSWL